MPTEQHLFSTGTLAALVSFGTSSITASRGDSLGGGPASPSSTPLANLTDGNPSTTASCNSDNSGYEYFILDLGSAQDIGQVNLSNVTVGTGSICGVDVSDTLSTVGIPGVGGAGSETSFVASSGNISPVTSENLTFVPSAGLSVSGRYVYISFTEHVTGIPTLTIGDVSILTAVNFAVVQEASIDFKWNCRELYTSASESEFPIDIGVGESSWEISASHIDVRADGLQMIIASQLSLSGGEGDLTLPQTISMPPILAVFHAQDTDGNQVQFTLNHAKASGVSLPFKLNDFAVERFKLTAFPDANGVMGTVVFTG